MGYSLSKKEYKEGAICLKDYTVKYRIFLDCCKKLFKNTDEKLWA